MTKRYAIIGAGAAGTYTAWRLSQVPGIDPKNITVYDSFRIGGQPHIGGRLWSERLPGVDYVRRAELGGMRFLGSHKMVYNLAQHLELAIANFPVDSASTGYMLRSTMLRPNEFSDPAKIPYKVGPRERGMSPGALLAYGVESIVPNAPYLTPEQWDELHATFKVRGELLRDQGAWTLLQTVLSQEGFSLAQQGSGYDTFTTNWNAADAMQWIVADFSPATQYLCIQNGFQMLPRKLLSEALARGVTYQNWHLKKYARKKSGAGLKLEFEDASDRTPHEIDADVLILAMPRRALELVDRPENVWLDMHLPAVIPEPMFKFFVAYHYPWWRNLGMSLGRTVTDGPLRQIYYWGTNDQHYFTPDTPGIAKPEGDNQPQNSLIMVYCDGRNTGYWKPLFESVRYNYHNSSAFDPASLTFSTHERKSPLDDPNFRVIDLSKTDPNDRSVPILLSAIADQLRAAHGITYIPEPYALAYADWTCDPLGGAYNLWEPGFHSREVMRRMLAPYGDDLPVHIVGEAYSLFQGWVEGALQTAELMCQEHLGLAPPEWLPPDVNVK